LNSNLLKFAAGVLAFAAWLALVIMGKAPAGQFVDALALTIAGLGVHGATITKPDVAVTGFASAAELVPATAEFAPAAAVATSAPASAVAPVTAQASAAPQPTIQ